MQRWAVHKQLGQMANQQVWKLANLLDFLIFRTCSNGRTFFAICDVHICDMETLFFKDIKLLQMHNFVPYQYRHKMLYLNFSYNKKIFSENATAEYLYSFAMKGLKKSQTVKWGVSCSMASGKHLRICGQRTGTKKCADLRFGDYSYNKFLSCDLRTCTCKKLPSCDSGMSPRIADFRFAEYKRKFACPPLLLCISKNKVTKPLNKVSKSQGLIWDAKKNMWPRRQSKNQCVLNDTCQSIKQHFTEELCSSTCPKNTEITLQYMMGGLREDGL